ncbi:hypothetical protein Dimus_029125 [Dionaea muscipula]
MRNIDDRNHLLLCIMNVCRDMLGRLPKVVGIDGVEMALWAKVCTLSLLFSFLCSNNHHLVPFAIIVVVLDMYFLLIVLDLLSS